MTYQIKGGKWVGIYTDCSVDLFPENTLYWLLNHVCCAQVTCAGWVYIFRGRVKNFMF